MTPVESTPSGWPSLAKTYRGRFPFRLGTTSFIYPAGYYENARRLAPFVEEIELILFESRGLPDLEEIRRLKALAAAHELRYNVHLPLDVFLGSADSGRRRRSVDVLLQALELTAPLDPTSWTLHLNPDPADRSAEALNPWQARAVDSIRQLRSGGFPAERLALENLQQPLVWMEAVRKATGLPVCMDYGHLLLNGDDPAEFYRRHRDRIIMLHLHGAADNRDHRSLNRLHSGDLHRIPAILKDYTGSVSLEVFDFEALQSSLETLEAMFPMNQENEWIQPNP